MSNLNVIKSVLFSLALVTGAVVNSALATPTAEEIMEKSGQAMRVPAHYRIVNQGIEMSIYQKPLPDGSLAMLTDISAPIKKTTIKYGEKSYDLYLDKKIAVDTHVLFAGAENLPEFAQLLAAAKDMKTGLILNRTFTYGGRECYEIEQAVQSPASMLASLPAAIARRIPVKNRLVIDTETFLIHEMEMIASDGNSISKIQYLDFEPMHDLTDEIFQLPEGFEVLSPQSIKEYSNIIMDLSHPRIPPVDVQQEFEQAKKKIEKENPIRFPDITLPIVSPPKELPDHIIRHQSDYPLPEKQKRPWAVIVAMNVIFVALMIWLIYRKRKNSVD